MTHWSSFKGSKYHGLGNAFLVALVDEVSSDVVELTRRLCDVHTGLAADGLLLGTPPTRTGTDLRFNLWNADGSPAEISGNGIRCLAHAEARRRGLDSVELLIEVGPVGGDEPENRLVSVRPGRDRLEVVASVAMGRARPGPAIESIPATASVTARRTATVDVGNPHLVILVDDPDAVDLAVTGPRIEAGYAGGINVHFVAPTDSGGLKLRVWERGAGVTQACGSGATAAAYVAHQWGLVGDRVRVSMPGGAADVAIGDELTLTGPSELIADFQVPVQEAVHD